MLFDVTFVHQHNGFEMKQSGCEGGVTVGITCSEMVFKESLCKFKTM